jgi:hypothetical protein
LIIRPRERNADCSIRRTSSGKALSDPHSAACGHLAGTGQPLSTVRDLRDLLALPAKTEG